MTASQSPERGVSSLMRRVARSHCLWEPMWALMPRSCLRRDGGVAVKLKQEARVLRRKAPSSLTVAMTAFNSPIDEGRVTRAPPRSGAS